MAADSCPAAPAPRCAGSDCSPPAKVASTSTTSSRSSPARKGVLNSRRVSVYSTPSQRRRACCATRWGALVVVDALAKSGTADTGRRRRARGRPRGLHQPQRWSGPPGAPRAVDPLPRLPLASLPRSSAATRMIQNGHVAGGSAIRHSAAPLRGRRRRSPERSASVAAVEEPISPSAWNMAAHGRRSRRTAPAAAEVDEHRVISPPRAGAASGAPDQLHPRRRTPDVAGA